MRAPERKQPDAVQPDALARRLATLGFPLDGEPLSQLAGYLSQLMRWNRAMNLVGASSWEDALDTLIIDSFHLAAFLRTLSLPPAPRAMDLGSGAGLPGIPLRMLWQDGAYTLVEAREKRALFMRTALAGMGLGDTRVFHGRAEDFFSSSPPADLIVSRAFMPWRDMLEFVKDALGPVGRIVFLTLAPPPDELPAPWRLIASTRYGVKGKDRHFWCFSKEAS